MNNSTHSHNNRHHYFMMPALILSVIAALGIAGCRTAPKQPALAPEYVYFPAPPDVPHAQFLCHLAGELPGFEQKSKNRFLDFLVGKPKQAPQYLVKPYGLLLHDNRLFVADTLMKGVAIIDFTNGSMKWIGNSGRGALRKPVNVSIGPDNTLYVSDTLRQQVIAYDKDGRYRAEFGESATFKPVDTLVSSNELFVLDLENSCIKVFDLATAKVLRTIGKLGTAPGEFNKPNAMAMDKEGNLYVCDAMNLRIQKLAHDGSPLLVFGKAGQGPGLLARPRGLAVSDDGIIYVTDAMMGVVQLFNQQGQALMHLGYRGFAEGELYLPAQVTLSKEKIPYFEKYLSPDFESEYLILVANNSGGNKISVFAFGHPKAKIPASPEPRPLSAILPDSGLDKSPASK